VNPQDTADKKRVSAYQPENGVNTDEMSTSPIGRLMSDEVGTVGEPSAYVSGFDRAPAAEPEPIIERPSRRERAGGEDGMSGAEHSSDKTPQPVDGDDFFEAGIREARAIRERRRQPNPAPRPAVRANVPTQRRMASMPSMSQPPPPEDAYDTFRQRYNPGELISSGKGGRPVRKAPPAGGERGPVRPAVDDSDTVSPLRYLMLGATVAFLGVLVFLLVHSHNLRGNYAEAQATIARMQEAYDSYHLITEQRDILLTKNEAQEITIENLQSELAMREDVGTPGVQQPNDPPVQPVTTEPPATTPQFPVAHVLQRGQNLHAVARLFYGDATPALIAHIANYNNLADPDRVREGDVINVPAPPS